MKRRMRFFEIASAFAAVLVVVFLLHRAAIPVTGQSPAGTGKAAEIKTPEAKRISKVSGASIWSCRWKDRLTSPVRSTQMMTHSDDFISYL
jgi:hypothetical protein